MGPVTLNLVVVQRQTYTRKTNETTNELSYYITNAPPGDSARGQLQRLAQAIRWHWGVESNNWVRDVTMGEDGVRIAAPNQAQVLALLRGLALTLLRRAGAINLQAQLELFCFAPAKLQDWLTQMRVL